MNTPFDYDDFHGERRENGSIIGFDYASQMWVDTALSAKRDASCKAGSASNPLPHLRDLPRRKVA